MKIRSLLIGCAASIAAIGIAASAGLWWGYPIVGSGSYCISYQNPTVVNGIVTSQGTCTSTAPAGPLAITGNELVIADTQLPGGTNPQTVLIPTAVLAARGEGSERNVLVGGDFLTNLWQRGTSFASATPTTSALTADRWLSYSSGNTVTINQQTGAADISPTLGVNAVMRVVRPSGTNTTSICVGQILTQAQSERFIGNEAVFSFYALANSGYLQTNQTVLATIYAWTSADSATPLTNSDAMMKVTLTNQSIINNSQLQAQAAAVTSTSAPTGSQLVPLNATMARYSVAGTVPVTINSVATTGIGITLCTGVYPASTGVAGDWFEFGNAQLEASAAPILVGGVVQSPGNTSPGGFSRRNPAAEALSELYYSWVIKEPAASISVAPSGQGASTTTCILSIPTPTQMREASSTNTVSTISSSTWTVTHVVTNTALTALATTTGGNTANMVNLTATVASGLTAGQTCTLTGAGGGATVVVSAEP